MDYVKALQDICLALVNDRDKLEVREMPSLDDNAIVLYVYASHDDISKLIGRKGVMANSIRQLMSVSTRGMHKRLDIKLNHMVRNKGSVHFLFFGGTNGTCRNW